MKRRPSNLLRIGLLLLVVGLSGSILPSPVRAQELSLGSEMPMLDQRLPTANQGQKSLSQLAGRQGTVVVFWSNQCPWVDRYEQRLLDLASTYQPKGFQFVLVNSNDPNAFPQESAQVSKDQGYEMPYLLDATSELARAFGASRAPHVFVFGSDHALQYVGAIDDSPGDPGNVTQEYLKKALDAVAAGEQVPRGQTKAFGCMLRLAN